MIPTLIIGRKGSRVKDKNVRPVLGRPLALYPILAAKHARHVSHVFVSTDSDPIRDLALANDCTYVERPAFLATHEALAEDAFKHGYEAIVAQAAEPVELIVLLFANGATITPGVIDEGIEWLRAHPEYDSAVSVSKYNMFSALRARRLENGLVKPFVDPALFTGASCDRDSQGDTYFVDCSVFVLRPRCFDYTRGEIPFRWIGRTVHPLHQEGGCDVDFEWQFPIVEHFLRRVGFSETETPYP
ncbi:MAG: cytidylyltransferase [Deltaproteobacteria bacterium]|nr:cytidylyltransferase [Deltaproteobacteria bacterium]